MLTRSDSNTENPKVIGPDRTMAAPEETPTIADLMEEIRTGNKKTGHQLTELNKTFKENKKMFEDYMPKNDLTVNKLRSELDEANKEVTTLKSTVTGLEGAVNDLINEIKAV